jgi:hypothetical protein
MTSAMNPHDALDAVRGRIYNVLPSASLQLQTLLNVVEVRWDPSIPTACVTCTDRPRLLLNKVFVTLHCRRDEHLFVLLLHELYHIILGHTRLFPRVTPVHNIVFDAVINALICAQFPARVYTSFFTGLYRADVFPECLLRPPDDWVARHGEQAAQWKLPPELPREAAAVLRRLYGKEEGRHVTYHEIFALLTARLQPLEIAAEPVLLGNHDSQDNQDLLDGNPVLRDLFRKVVEDWPAPTIPITGRDQGHEERDFLLRKGPPPEQAFRRALRRLLVRAGVHAGARSNRRRSVVPEETAVLGVLPEARDRRSLALRILTGRSALYRENRLWLTRRARVPQPVAHVYLDISGSMNALLPSLAAVFAPLHAAGVVRLFVFSTVVDEVRPGELTGQSLNNTGGTEIDCVAEHILRLPGSRRVRRVVLVTDGYVGQVRQGLRDELCERGIRLFAGITTDGARAHTADLAPVCHYLEILPPIRT